MKKSSTIMAICLLSLCTACAHTSNGSGFPDEQKKDHRLRNTLLAVGAAVIVSVIAANQAQDNARDLVRPPPQN